MARSDLGKSNRLQKCSNGDFAQQNQRSRYRLIWYTLLLIWPLSTPERSIGEFEQLVLIALLRLGQRRVRRRDSSRDCLAHRSRHHARRGVRHARSPRDEAHGVLLHRDTLAPTRRATAEALPVGHGGPACAAARVPDLPRDDWRNAAGVRRPRAERLAAEYDAQAHVFADAVVRGGIGSGSGIRDPETVAASRRLTTVTATADCD